MDTYPNDSEHVNNGETDKTHALGEESQNDAADETHRGQDPTPPTYSSHTDIC